MCVNRTHYRTKDQYTGHVYCTSVDFVQRPYEENHTRRQDSLLAGTGILQKSVITKCFLFFMVVAAQSSFCYIITTRNNI